MANVIRGMPAPSSNGTGEHPKKPKKVGPRHFTAAPTLNYQPTGGAWWGYASAHLDNRPLFTWLDVPRMMVDPQVRFVAQLWRAPFQKVDFTVRASGPKVAAFVTNTVKRFWRASLPKILARYFEYGFGPGGAEYTALRGRVRLARVKAVEPWDAEPRVFKSGERAGQFAGFQLKNAHAAGGAPFVGSPHAFWFAGQGRVSPYYDTPPLSGMFAPWLEKNGRGGAIHMRRLWFRKNAARGAIGYYPDGTSNVGTDENPSTRTNQDLMREILDIAETNSTYAFVNDRHPADPASKEWEIIDAKSQGDIAGFREYPKDLDEEMVKGAGIPLEVIQGSDSGSGYKGRLVSYGGFLGTVDELTGLILEACEPWLSPLVALNYGPDAWYEIEPVSLAKIAAEEEKRQPTNPVGQPLASLPPGGGGGDAGAPKPGGGEPNLPFQLSVTAPPAQPELLGAVKALETVAAAMLAALKAQGEARELAATVTPDDTDETAKKQAFDGAQKRLMRIRKSNLAQLLSLALLRAQQKATAAGHPEQAAGTLRGIAQLASDPMEVARVVGSRQMSVLFGAEAVELAWTQFTTAKETVGAVSDTLKDALGRPKKLYGRAAAAALAAGDKRTKRETGEKAAQEVINKLVAGKATLEDVPTLAENLSHMKLADINKSITYLEAKVGIGFNMRGEKAKKRRIERILDHVEKKLAADAGKDAPAPRVPPDVGNREKKPKGPAPAAAPKTDGAAGEAAAPKTAPPAPEPPKAEPKPAPAPKPPAAKSKAAPAKGDDADRFIAEAEAKLKAGPKPGSAEPRILKPAEARAEFPDHTAMRGEYANPEAAKTAAAKVPGAHILKTRTGYQILRPPVPTDGTADPDSIVRAIADESSISTDPAPPERPGEKKPWEMPPAEFLAAARTGRLRQGSGRDAGEASAKTNIGAGELNEFHPNDIAHFYLVRHGRDGFAAAHRAYLEDAIAEGKSVSPAALADYPDLKAGSGARSAPEPQPASAPAPGKKGRSNKEVKVSADEIAKNKAQEAGRALVKAFEDRANPSRLLELYERARVAADSLPDDLKAKYLDKLKAALPKEEGPADPKPSAADAAATLYEREAAADEPDPAPAKGGPLLTDADRALLAKRRGKAPAPAPAPKAAPVPEKPAAVAEKVKEEVAKPAPKEEPKPAPKAKKAPGKKPAAKPKAAKVVGVDALKDDPGADKRYLESLAESAPDDEVRDAIKTAAYNAAGAEFDAAARHRGRYDFDEPTSRRWDTANQLASEWRRATVGGRGRAAAALAGLLAKFGAKVVAPPPPKQQRYDDRYDLEAGLGNPGDPIAVVRPPVVWTAPDGSEVVLERGVARKRTVG